MKYILTISTVNPEKTAILLTNEIFTTKTRPISPARKSDSSSVSLVPPAAGHHARSTSGGFFRQKSHFGILAKKVWRAKTHQSEELLPQIDKMLRQKKVKTENLGLIIVNTGPGSFTGTRVGVATANAFAFGLEIPVVGVVGGESEIEEITKMGLKLYQKKKIKIGEIARPYYSQAPNITTPKKKKF